MSHQSFAVKTRLRNQFLEITDLVRTHLEQSGIQNGLGVVYCPHTTAGITINEAYDPDVVHDMLLWFDRIVPHQQPGFRHGEGNSDSHIKTALIGSSAQLIVSQGQLVLGRWQGIYLCEFDGPRLRDVFLQWVGQ